MLIKSCCNYSRTCDVWCPPHLRVNPRGWNVYGQLGVGDTVGRGGFPGSMGDALPAVNLGPGRSAVEVSTTNSHTCALLDDGSIRCWGRNDYGQLGMGDTANRLGPFGATGTLMPAVSLGTGALVRSVSHACMYYLDQGFRVGDLGSVSLYYLDQGFRVDVLGMGSKG